MTTTADEPLHARYDILAKIGEGPRGPMFVARRTGDVSADPLYGIEQSAFATGEDELARAFMRDVERAAHVQHRNVLGILELGATSAGRFVVTEYIEGCALSELQERHRAIRPPRLVLMVLIDALAGLHAAHTLAIDGMAQPLIHGGVSPDHLRLGLDGVCRLAGFGNARPRVQTRPSHRTGSAAGYMTPEQLTGAELGPRSDVFAMGIVLWNALTGKKLFHDRVEHMTMSNVLERKVPRPSKVGLSPPPALDAAVLKALERDPARRYHSAGEMAAALRDAGRAASCLATSSEVGEWIATTFGTELAARRRTIRELTGRSRRASTEPPALGRLGGPVQTEPGAFDELSLDELARATEPPPRAGGGPRLPPIAIPPGAANDPPSRRQLVLVAAAALAVVAVVLGWRIWQRSAPEPYVAMAEPAPNVAAAQPVAAMPAEIEVTVLDVHSVAPPRPEPPDPLPAPAQDPAPPRTAPIAPPSSPPRAAVRSKKPPPPSPPSRPSPPPRPAEPHVEPSEPEPAAPRVEHAPAKPETPPRPTLESNPYLYNK